MKNSHYSVTSRNEIRVAIDSKHLEKLIAEGLIGLADFTCLDRSSKQGVWTMLRSLAVSKLQLL